MWIEILVGIAVLLGALVALIASRPSSFEISRAAEVIAPPDVVFGFVNDFRRWDAWSPWAKLDPNMETHYSGAESGVGAGYAWKGNKQVGEGRMTILESLPPKLIRIRLEFLKPFQTTNETTFMFTPIESATRVNWSMTGHHNFMSKAFCLFMNMDKMVGKDFEKGLAAMKSASEGEHRGS